MCWFYSKWPLTNYIPHGYSGPFYFHYMQGCLGVTPGTIHCHWTSSTLHVCLGVQPLQLKVPPALSLLPGFLSFKVHQSHGNVFKMWIPGSDTLQILSKQEIDEDWESDLQQKPRVILLQMKIGSNFNKHNQARGECLGACLYRLPIARWGESRQALHIHIARCPLQQWREL